MSNIANVQLNPGTHVSLTGSAVVPVLDGVPSDVSGVGPTVMGYATLGEVATFVDSGGGTGPLIVTDNSAAAFAVGPTGATNPTFNIDASTASQTCGISITGSDAITGGGAIAAIGSGADAGIAIDAKGAGSIDIAVRNTGANTVTIGSGQAPVLLQGTTNVVGATGQQVGFYGHAASAQQVLATGAAHTVDDVITALQNLGLVKQS